MCDDLLQVRGVLESLPDVGGAEVFRIRQGPGTAIAALVRGRHPVGPAIPGADVPAVRYTGPDTAPAIAAIDRAAVLAMAQTLRRAGLFAAGMSHDGGEVADALRASVRHRWIVHRWLVALTDHRLLECDPEAGGYRRLAQVSRAELSVSMGELDKARQDLGYPAAMGRFFQTTLRCLPALVSDERTVQSVLFADGRTDTADANYRYNLISRHLNAVAAAAAADAVRRAPAHRRPRILEVGAGVGATTAGVLSEVGPADYLFTDVSAFFLDAARHRFAGHDGLRYALLDVNAPVPAAVAMGPRHDVVLAANVLHNSRHTTRTLAMLRELLSHDGTLVIIESCREHAVLSTGMHFLMSAPPDDPAPGFADMRADQDRIFPTAAEWTRALHAAGFAHIAAYPGPLHALAPAGQYVFTARPRDPSPPRPDPHAVRTAAAALLPARLVPIEVHAVDAVA
ncbi:MAG: class I SAM-dependent methyltransferase [Streptomycetaceae bacterium]|nr:class I SAM-dependent methyltransferase [Streptomycetaceae bacterium]